MIKLLFKWLWRKWLNKGDVIVKIIGWNKALISDKWGQKSRTIFLLKGMI